MSQTPVIDTAGLLYLYNGRRDRAIGLHNPSLMTEAMLRHAQHMAKGQVEAMVILIARAAWLQDQIKASRKEAVILERNARNSKGKKGRRKYVNQCLRDVARLLDEAKEWVKELEQVEADMETFIAEAQEINLGPG